VKPFRKFGELVLGNTCPWVSRELTANMLTPLMKKATGNDADQSPPKNATAKFGRGQYTKQLLILSVRWYIPSSLGSGS
jgi:hypothetical protein